MNVELVYSSNTVYAQVAEAIGIDKILQTCYAMGIRTQLQPYLSTTLGSQGVTPIEQCTAFATLAAGGVLLNRGYALRTKSGRQVWL